MPAPTSPLLLAAHRDLATGTLLGSALGDTIGLYTEFLSASSSLAAYPTRRFTLTPTPTTFHPDLHRLSKPPRHWTDDTDHALLLLLAYLHTSSLPTQQDLASRLRIWVQQGLRPLNTMPLGLGRLVGTVVATKGFDVDPEAVARKYWVDTGKRVAPNGSLMRTHPLGVMCIWEEEEVAFRAAAKFSRATHVDPRCVVACVIGTGLVRGLVRGEVRSETEIDGVVERGRAWFIAQGGDEELDADELERHVRAQSLEELKLDEAAAIGYVYKALGAGLVVLRLAMRRVGEDGGLWARSRIFEELITELVMQGGDADTNACFAGALLGGYLGYGMLPDHWKHGLEHEEWLMEKVEGLCQVLGLSEGRYDGAKDKDTLPDGGNPISQAEMEGRWMVLQADVAKKMEELAKASSSKAKGWPPAGWSLPWQGKDKTKR
ncbi:hypothetical protein OQA88_1230 [Cercophora sp. LCS_1]